MEIYIKVLEWDKNNYEIFYKWFKKSFCESSQEKIEEFMDLLFLQYLKNTQNEILKAKSVKDLFDI